MDRTDPYDMTRAIASLNPWQKAARHNWALVPQTTEDAFLVSFAIEKEPSPVKARILLFPGLATFRDFILSRETADYGVGMSPIDFRHFEACVLRDNRIEIFRYAPGFVPLPPTVEEKKLLAALLYEIYGIIMRMEENPDLPKTYLEQNALFARKEVVDGVWIDGPLRLPAQETVQQVEKVELKKDACATAKTLPVYPKEAWEVDFVMIPAYHTRDAQPRFLYLLAAVDRETGERRVWERMSVDGAEGGLLRLWEGHAQRLLDACVKCGRVPGELHIRSQRVARFLRPLAMQLPFKMVQHAKLPAFDSVVNLAVQTRRV